MLIISYMGDHVWLMTSRQTEPDLRSGQQPSDGLVASTQYVKNRFYCSQFIDIWVEDAVYEANARALVRVLVGQFDVDLPETSLEWCCLVSRCHVCGTGWLTVFWPLEPDIELLPALY
jgi:hypothetical protein